MKRTIAASLALSLCLFPVPTLAQQNQCGTGPSVPISAQTLTVSTTAVALTVPSGANQAVLFFNTNNVRVAYDGTAPTTSVGAILQAGQSQLICALTLAKVQMIRDDASDAEVYAVYSGAPN